MNYVPMWCCIWFLFAGLMFGHTTAKYTRSKQITKIYGIIMLLVGLFFVIYFSKPL